jgi:hypothetical protein
MVMMFVGGVVFGSTILSALFLMQATYGAGVLCSCPKVFCYRLNYSNQKSGLAVKNHFPQKNEFLFIKFCTPEKLDTGF